MKITIDTIGLNNAVSIAHKYTNRKEGAFVNAITFTGNKGFVTIAATNGLELIELRKLPFIASELGVDSFDSFTIDSNKMSKVTKAAKGKDTSIEIHDGFVSIKSARSSVKIEKFAEVQKFNEVECENTINIGIELSEAFKQVRPTIDSNNPKHELNGMQLAVKDNKLSVASTDTRRLSAVELNVQMQDTEIIIPRDAVDAILNLFGESAITANFSTSYMIVETETLKYTTSLFSGSFPEWRRIIPSETSSSIVLNCSLVSELLKEVSVFESEVVIDIYKNTITIVDAEGNATVSETIEDTGVDVIFSLNSKYLLDFFAVVNEDKFELKIDQPNLPLVVSANETFKEVIMPIASHGYIRVEPEITEQAVA